MASFIPIALLGDNLGQRHRYLNSLVCEAKNAGINFQDLEALPEETPVDRLFKIDLAIKLKNVDYIIRNLKGDDMLYVSRALKATWLLENRNIVNPNHLEDVLFPEMVVPAVSRMKHWLYINLRDPSMCQGFYQHYKENSFEFAIKFLSRCNNDFIMNEMPTILTKTSTYHLKVLSEKCPKVAKIYFDSLATNEEVIKQYLRQEQSYYNCVKCVLKTDAEVYLDITEKYFNVHTFSRLSPVATNYIISHHKNRFQDKLELYVAYILHIPTLAARLSVEECKEVVIKLAQAKFLEHWFNYKVVEPLIKRISPDKRAAFKKQIFVNKDVGEHIQEWPYELPGSPQYYDYGPCVFDDEEFSPFYKCTKRMIKKRKCARFNQSDYLVESCMPTGKSELDRLFEEFRFVGFDRALHDLGQRLRATGSADRRRDMFLVLVSKSGGRSEAVSALLRLAARHSNEPAHTRAAVLRSLVKRANVWRLPEDVWSLLLDFGHGLGLNGAAAEAACREGFHAVVIRQLLNAGECEPAIRNVFLDDFSSLKEYSLSAEERACVVVGLQKMLLATVEDEEPSVAAVHLDQLFDVLKDYGIRIQALSSVVDAVKALGLRDEKVARPLLERLYDAGIARRELFRMNLEFRRDEAALLNALRHDPCALDVKRVTEILLTSGSQFDRFLSKLIIYFAQKEDLAMKLRNALRNQIPQTQDVKLIRPLASLLGRDFEKTLQELDANTDQVRFAAALRACAHLSRPSANIADWGWQKAGVKAVATRAMRCREVERSKITCALAAERRTVRVALVLSIRAEVNLLLECFAAAAKVRPTVALHVALAYFHRYGVQADRRVWDIIKPLMLSVDLRNRLYLRRLLGNTHWIPMSFKADYCTALYFAIDELTKSDEHKCRTLIESLRDLSQLLPEISNESIQTILIQMFDKTDNEVTEIPFPAIYVRYLMLSKDDQDLNRRFEMIGHQLLDRMNSLCCKHYSGFQERLDQTIQSLKYNAAFLDGKYTSCLSVIGRFLDWMQTFMPKEEHFQTYVQIHLTMLYFKAIRQSMKQMPEVFGDPKKLKSEGVDAVGYVFGRYIATEVAELMDKYFDSIIELYTDALLEYFNDNFLYGSSKAKFIASVLKGILAEGKGREKRIAIYVFQDHRYDVEDSMRNEIESLLLKDKPLDFFVYGELFN